MPNVIDSFRKVTSEWIEQVLEIPRGTVSSCTILNKRETPVTQVAVIRIEYRTPLPCLPQSVFIKIAKAEQPKEVGEICAREVLFYAKMTNQMPARCTPKSYFAASDENSGDFTIVLEDLSETHFQTEYPLPPTIVYCEMAIDCLAGIHAAWRNKQLPQEVLGKHLPMEDLRKSCMDFLEFMDDRLSEERKSIVRIVAENLDCVSERYLNSASLTLAHGDTHLWNFYFPKDKSGSVKLFDWQFYDYGFGTDDLAAMMALNWYAERRKKYEESLLRRYHTVLTASGVRAYSFEEMLREYRWSIIRGVGVPVWQCEKGIPSFIWFNNLERILQAFEDLNCVELLPR